jgi:hypothetical protein
MVTSISTPSFSKNTCAELFENNSTIQKITNLIIKDAASNPPVTKYWGLLTKSQNTRPPEGFFAKAGYYAFDFIPNKLGHLITLNKEYSFTPFQAVDEILFDKPTRIASQKLTGKKKELGILLKIPLITMLSISSWHFIDQNIFWPMAETRVTQQILNNTEKNASYYDQLIATDFRFKDIKSLEAKNKAPEVRYDGKNTDSYIESPKINARFLAYGLEQSYENYFKIYSHTKNPGALTLEENINLFGSNPLFEHLSFFFENGVKQFEGTYVPPKFQGPLSDAQKNDLFNLTHLLYAKYLIIDVMFDQKTDLPKLLTKNALAHDIYNDPYTQTLIKLYKHGKITRAQLIFDIQEDAHNAYYMSLFKTLHIVNLKYENGVYTSEPLTLQDLRESRVSEIQ